MSKNEESVIRIYNCNICNENHKVQLDKSLIEEHSKFPFPYVYLHGDLKDILAILYLDQDLQIRGAEVQNLTIDSDNVFSKEHASTIAENLMEEVESLRKENEELRKELANLKG